MGNIVTGVDLTRTNFPTPAELDQLWDLGTRVISSYISYSPDWKDITSDQIKALHTYRRNSTATTGFAVLLNFESTADRALSGASAGLYDGTTVRTRIHQHYADVGYKPFNKLTVPFSVDFDTNPSQYPTIDAYLRAAQQGLTAEFIAGDYGEFDLITHTAKAGTSHFEWQAYAWSNGHFASGIADYYQWKNSQKLRDGHVVDFDQIISDGRSPFGAWWPPGHPLNSGPTPSPAKPTVLPSTGDDLGDLVYFLMYAEQRGRWTAQNHPNLVRDIGPGLAAALNKLGL